MADIAAAEGVPPLAGGGGGGGATTAAGAVVYVARDTRATSEVLAGCFADGVRLVGAAVRDYGVMTTPQLHWMVFAANGHLPDIGAWPGPQPPSADEYYARLASAFALLSGLCEPPLDLNGCASADPVTYHELSSSAATEFYEPNGDGTCNGPIARDTLELYAVGAALDPSTLWPAVTSGPLP